ncbi:MAG: hypothetical protein RI101_02810 [Nitrospira sp.]|jgi:hypothetical protein|nr:hypothetical protein [Nitrospira sp.]
MDTDAEFDIRTPIGRDRLAQYHTASCRQDQLALEEIVDALESLVHQLGTRSWMIWRCGGFSIPTGHKSHRQLDIAEAVDLGHTLSILARCDGFDEFLRGFNNPTQFADSIFEAQMARWCLNQPNIKGLRFAPKHTVLGRYKRPDFELKTPIGRVVCECKRLHLRTQDWAKRLIRVADTFDTAIYTSKIPEDLRLEVSINRAIYGDLRAAAELACRQIKNEALGKSIEHGPFSLRLSQIGSKITSNNSIIRHGRIRVGSTPIERKPENYYLLLSSPWMERAVFRTIGAAINDAHRQLPEDHDSVIFIDSPRIEGRKAAADRLLKPEYAHCLAVAIVREGKVEFSRRSTDEEVVDWLFFGKVPPLSRRLRYMVAWRSGLRRMLLRKLARPTT